METTDTLEIQIVEIDYTNWQGKRGLRRIRPIPGTLQFKSTEHHPTPQWLFDAVDLDKKALRTFALSDIHSWKSINASL